MAKTLYYNAVTEEMEFVNSPSPLRENFGERFGLSEGGRIGFVEGKRVTIEPNIRRSTTTGTYFVEKHMKNDSFDTLTEARKFIKKIAKENPKRTVGWNISSEILQEIKKFYLEGNSALTISKNLIKKYPNKEGISPSSIGHVIDRLKTKKINTVPQFTKTELANKPDIRGVNQFEAIALDPQRLNKIQEDAFKLTKSEIIKKHNVSIQSLIKLEKAGKVKFPMRGVGKPPFKPHVTEDAKTVLKILESEPKITTSGLEKKLGWSKLKIASATKALKNIISPKTGAIRTGVEIPSSLKKAILNLKDPVGSVEEDLLKAGIKKSDVDKITRGRVAVREFFPQGTNFEHHLPRNLFSYFKDKNIQYKLDITGSRTSPELNRFKLRYDRLMKGAVNEFLSSEATANDLKVYNEKIKNIRNIVRKATNGYEMGYIEFDLNKNPKPVLFAKSIEEGTRSLGPESSQKLNTFKNTKYTETLLKNYKNNPNSPIYSTLKDFKLPQEITSDYINQYSKYAKDYEKIKPYLSSREKIISYAKTHLNNPVVKALFKKPYGKFGLALTAATLLPSVLAAKEPGDEILEPSDEKQEAGVLPSVIQEHPILSGAAATVAPIFAKKAWEGVKWAGRKLIPIMTPAASHAFKIWEGKPYDPTSGHDATSLAFWNSAIKAMGKTSKLGDANVPLMKRLKDMAWRGLLPTRFLPLISGAGAAAMGPLLIKDAAAWLQGHLEKQDLTGKGGIADYAGIISDEAGGSLFIEDVVKEKQKQAAEGMDYAQGGIASLIK